MKALSRPGPMTTPAILHVQTGRAGAKSNRLIYSIFKPALTDSLVGGLNLLAEGKKVALVGHYGAGVTNSVQERVLKVVSQAYGEGVTPFMFHAQPAKRGVEGEPSMRSRSFLFFAMGVAVASAVGGTAPLVVAENGLISLNVPLTSSRNG